MAVGQRDDAFELRILSGLHKGARAVLSEGDTVVIGSDASCDFILRDSAVPARLLQLQQRGGAWMLQWLTASGQAESPQQILIPKDKAVSLAAQNGGSDSETPVLAVQPVHMPWPKVVPALISRIFQNEAAPAADGGDFPTEAILQGAASKDAHRAAVGTAPDSQSLPHHPLERADSAASAAAYPAPLAGSWLKNTGPLTVISLLFLIAMVLVIYLTLGWFQQNLGVPTAIDSAALPALTTGRVPDDVSLLGLDKSRAAITAIASQLKLLPRIRIDSADLGQSGLLVHAGPLTDDETEALAAALSQLSPRPGLRVVSEFSLREAVQEAMARQNTAHSTVLTATPLALGRFQIQGRLPENADRDAVLAALRTEFAGLVVFESALQTSADRAALMLAELQKTGIASVQGQWQTGKLLLQVQTSKANLPLWEASLSRIATRYALPFTATLSWAADASHLASNTKAVGSQNPRLQPGLPFALQSIIGGPTPYVVTADGGKLLPGGSYQGWKLMDISPERALFVAAQGAKRVEVRR